MVAYAGVATSADVPPNDAYLTRMWDSRFALAKLYEGDFEGAKTIADQLVEQRPENIYPLVLRSDIYLAMGDEKAAEKDMDRAYEITPTHSFLAFKRVGFLSDRGRFDEAAKALEVPHKNNKNLMGVMLAETWLLTAQGKLDEARKLFRRAILKPQNAKEREQNEQMIALTHVRLAEANMKAGDLWPAIADLQSAMRIKLPNTPEVALKLGEAYEADGRIEQAESLYANYPEQFNVERYPKLLEESKARLATIRAKLAELAELEKKNEPLARELVQVIDVYRRAPQDEGARMAVLNEMREHYLRTYEGPFDQPILRISKEKPEGVTEPEAISAAREAAAKLYKDRAGQRLYNVGPRDDYTTLHGRVMALYPDPKLLFREAVDYLSEEAGEIGLERVMLAEAVRFSEYYYDRAYPESYEGEVLRHREVAKYAYTLLGHFESTPVRKTIWRMNRLERESEYIEAQRIKQSVKDSLTNAELAKLQPMLDTRGYSHRNRIEYGYQAHWEEAVAQNDQALMQAIVEQMLLRRVNNSFFGAELMAYCGEQDDAIRFDLYRRLLLQNDPHNIGVYIAQGDQAMRDGQDGTALLYYNAAVQFYAKAGSPHEYNRKITPVRKKIAELEKPLGQDLANGYWQQAGTYERGRQKLDGHLWRPVVEAAAMRVLELAPNNPAFYSLIAQYRAQVKDYKGAIEAAKKGLAAEPDQAGSYNLTLGNSYANMLPSTTMHREQLAKNYELAFAAYTIAIEKKAMQPLPAFTQCAPMYEEIGQVDKALAAYRYVGENTTSEPIRANAYYKLATLAEASGQADEAQIIADLNKAIKGYEEIRIPTFEMRHNAEHASKMLERLTQDK